MDSVDDIWSYRTVNTLTMMAKKQPKNGQNKLFGDFLAILDIVTNYLQKLPANLIPYFFEHPRWKEPIFYILAKKNDLIVTNVKYLATIVKS